MERLTYDFSIGGNHCWQVKGADNLECREVCQRQGDKGCKDCPIAVAFDRLAAIEDILGDEYDLDRLCELAQADREERSKQMKRDEILEAARGCVCGEREQDYGSPENSFGLIARLWEDYLQSHCVWSNGCVDINSKDVAVMMILLKVARVAGGSKSDDNWIDIAGYAACGGEIMSGGDSNACIGD